MMERVSRDLVSRILGDGWETSIVFPEAEKKASNEVSFVDSEAESRNNEG